MSGIAKSDQFILFLSDQCMSRPFVQHEVREAIKLGRKVSVGSVEVPSFRLPIT
jgi:hypothetical protein